MFASILKLVSKVRQLFAADNFSRRHFSDAFFLGALRIKDYIFDANSFVLFGLIVILGRVFLG